RRTATAKVLGALTRPRSPGYYVSMNTIRRLSWLALLPFALAACDPPLSKLDAKVPAKSPPAPTGDVKKVELGKNVTLEIQGDVRRVVIPGEVCFREGPLEVFLC